MLRAFAVSAALALLLSAAGCARQQEKSESESPAVSVSDGQPEASSAPEAERIIMTLTVPEGYTLPRIGMTLEEMGICTVEAFIAAAQEADVSHYPLLAGREANPNRCYALEGYLFPDTYEIYSDDGPAEIIHRMLSNFEARMSPQVRALAHESGYSFSEIITLASIIEKEAFGYEVMPEISSVLHNRLDAGMRLQCDVTINYVEGAVKPFVTGDPDRYSAYYNTYKCDGIPAGPICNPGLDAIVAAMRPEDTDYFFFVTDADNNYHFSATWEGHLENVAEAMPPAA